MAHQWPNKNNLDWQMTNDNFVVRNIQFNLYKHIQ